MVEPLDSNTINRLLAILEQTLAFIKTSYRDSIFTDKDEVLKKLESHIENIKTREDLKKENLALLFAPTGPIQKLSISNGWFEQYLEISRHFDKTIDL